MSLRSEQPREDNMSVGSDIVGREDFVRRLVGQLIGDADDSSELRVISVLGERAIGKTAVVRSVYDRLDIKRRFTSRAWVRVLAGSGLEDILFDVLRQTTTCTLKDVDYLRKPHLSEMLEETLIKQRYLVVLDNLQSVDLMEKLLITFADCRNGSRVIITTYNVNMSLRPGPRHSGHIELCCLTEEESEDLFKRSARTRDLELPTSILRKCRGCPPAIRLLGLLSTDGQDLQSILAEGVPNNLTLREIISVSYDSLPAWLRPCLLYLVLFPRESEIPVRRLFNIWLADGLLASPQGRRGEVHEHGTQECLDALVARNLIHVVSRKLDGSAKTCLMPGFLHDFLSEKAMDFGTSEISDVSMSTSSRQPRVPSIAVKILINANGEQETMVRRTTIMSSLSLNSTKHLGCSPPELHYIAIKMDEDNRQRKQMHRSNSNKTQYASEFFRSFMLFTTWKPGEHAKEIEMFLKPLGLRRRFPWLKVLDLERVYKPMLPKRLGRLMPNLRYLGLRWTALVSLPRSVKFMSFLDTLDLKHTNVASVPSSILKKGSLQHLYMNEVCLDRSFRHKASYRKSLYNLKTLWGLYIGGKSRMLDVLGKLTGLRKLGLTCHYKVANTVAKSVARLTNLQSLRLRSLDLFDHSSDLELSDMCNLRSLSNLHLIGAVQVDGFTGLPHTLQILTLSMTKLAVDPMQVLRELKGLTTLRLLGGSYMGQSMTSNQGTFPELRVLKLWKLELLTDWTIEASALPRLEELEIRNCTSLACIVGLEHVQGLEEITLTEVNSGVAVTAEKMFPKAVVMARGLAVSPQQEGDDTNEEGDSDEAEADSGDDGGADEEQGDNEEEDDEEPNCEVCHGNECEEGDSNCDKQINGADEEQESEDEDEDEDEPANEDGDGDEDEAAIGDGDADGGEDKNKDYYEEEEDGNDNEGGEGGGGGYGNEEGGNDGGDSDYENADTDFERNYEGEDPEQNDTDEAEDEGQNNYEEREGNEEKEEENDNEEGDDNNDEEIYEGEDEEQQFEDLSENDHDPKGDGGNSGKEEEKEKQSGAEAEDGDDSDHERGVLNDDDDGGETKSRKMNVKLELNMELQANVKNEFTLTMLWKKTKDDKK